MWSRTCIRRLAYVLIFASQKRHKKIRSCRFWLTGCHFWLGNREQSMLVVNLPCGLAKSVLTSRFTYRKWARRSMGVRLCHLKAIIEWDLKETNPNILKMLISKRSASCQCLTGPNQACFIKRIPGSLCLVLVTRHGS